MKNKFINFSNHPTAKWSDNQLAKAQLLGEVLDIPFPMIPEQSSHSEVYDLAEKYMKDIQQNTQDRPCTVHIMGEMTFTYAMVNLLKAAGYTCVASTSKRIVEELSDGSKNVKFEFCQFREY